MKPILIDVSKFGGEPVLKDLQKLVDDAYEQGLKDGARKLGFIENKSLVTPPISFSDDGMIMGDFGWDEAQSL